MLEKFIEENMMKTYPFIKTPSKEVYERYLSFCLFHKLKPLGRKKFYVHLALIGMGRENTVSRKNFKGWYMNRCPY